MSRYLLRFSKFSSKTPLSEVNINRDSYLNRARSFFFINQGPRSSSCNAKLNKPSKLYAIIVVRRKPHRDLLDLSVVTLVALYVPAARAYNSFFFSLPLSSFCSLSCPLSFFRFERTRETSQIKHTVRR